MNQSGTDKYTLMTTMPVPRLICSLAVPTIISMLVTSFYVMADTYFVGQINTQSTAAVGISFSVMAIIQAIGFFLDTDPEISFPGGWEPAITRVPRRWLLPDSSAPLSAAYSSPHWGCSS